MISQSLLQWQRDRKYRLDGDTVYGVANGVGFSVVEEDGGKLAIFMLVCSNDSAFDGMEDMLRTQGDISALQVGDVEGYLALFYDESMGQMSSYMLDDMLAFVSANYRSLGFRAPNVCVKCGAPANKRSFYNNMVQPMCADCSAATKAAAQPTRQAPAPQQRYDQPEPLRTTTRYDEEQDDTYSGMERGRTGGGAAMASGWDRQAPEQAYDESTSMGKGVLGAVIGTVAGLIPYGISILCNFPLSALCVLCGVFAVFGYVVFGGLKDKKTGSIATIAISEVVSLAAIIATLMISESGATQSYAILIHGVLGALATFLGIALAIDALNKYVQE